MAEKDLYGQRGVSAQKEEVHAATARLDKGLFPRAFCKVYRDVLCGDDDWVNVMHADGAGTKSILAYLYWKETGDISVWKGIARDAIVMNLDDLLCVGIHDQLLFSSTIDRNKRLIPGEVLGAIISGTQEFFDTMKSYGVGITYMGGETADVGDVVRTIAVNGTMTARWPKARIVSNEQIAPGDVIVGLAGFGQCNYETEYNSGIASNGLTSARHDVLDKHYLNDFPESADPGLLPEVAYIGTHRLQSEVTVEGRTMPVGKLLLSPTRTFAPVMKVILEEYFGAVKGLIHCSGGGQTKCLKYVPDNVAIIKDNLFAPPAIFSLIREASKVSEREMYEVFNMGTRLEIYTDEQSADRMIHVARQMGVEAQLIGRVEASATKSLTIHTPGALIRF